MVHLKEFAPFTQAESKPISECEAADIVVLGDGALPDEPTQACEVRASVIRQILIDAEQDVDVHEKGMWVRWEPSASRSDLGRIAWSLRWFVKAIGWVERRLQQQPLPV